MHRAIPGIPAGIARSAQSRDHSPKSGGTRSPADLQHLSHLVNHEQMCIQSVRRWWVLARHHAASSVAERLSGGGSVASWAAVYSAFHRWRSAMACRRTDQGGTSGSAGAVGSHWYGPSWGPWAGWMPACSRSCRTNSPRSARWSSRVLLDHFRETRTRRPAMLRCSDWWALPLQRPGVIECQAPWGWMP
jgi:hypothetical protein